MPINRGLKRLLPALQATASSALLTETEATRTSHAVTAEQVVLGGCQVDLLSFDNAVATIVERAASTDDGAAPLAVVSANLDHIHHFGHGGRWASTFADRPHDERKIEWLTLLDGAPLVSQAERLTGSTWPRLAGSDLINPLLDAAVERTVAGRTIRVGFLGGAASTQQQLAETFRRERPDLAVAGFWAPERSELADPAASRALASRIADADVDLLIVGLGKPRQELWIAEYGHLTGAKVLLAFGAVVDFLAGRVERAPEWVSSHGLEWAWRLHLEPRRLAKRYLVDGPPSYRCLRTHSALNPAQISPQRVPGAVSVAHPSSRRPGSTIRPLDLPATPGTFITADEPVDVAVIAVTYNNAQDVNNLIAGLRAEAADLRLRVIVADNQSSDGTLDALRLHADVVALSTGGNLGYAGGINAARPHVGEATAVLVLNPDLRVTRGAIATMFERLAASDAGIVVPLLLDDDGRAYPSLRREPTLTAAFGDALVGSRFAQRPDWLSEIDYNSESYAFPHTVDWATGAALLIRSELAEALGDWDERFFLYSEETEYCRRARQAGASIWFEPSARMVHSQGGSGSSAELGALLCVNRVRYAELTHSRAYAAAFRVPVMLAEVLRSYSPEHRRALWALASRRRWDRLPHATRPVSASVEGGA